MTVLTWIAVDARTGRILADLTDVTTAAPLMVTIGRYEQLQISVPPPTDVMDWYTAFLADQTSAAPPLSQLGTWRTATRPGGVIVIALLSGVPLWGGLIVRRTTDHDGNALLDLVTLEGYLDRRYVGAYSATGRRQDLIVSDLIGSFIADGSLPGLTIRIANTASGLSINASHADADDQTLYTVLQSMSGVIGGPEWTVGFEYSTDLLSITPVLYVADRLGSPAGAGLIPKSLWNMPGCVLSAGLLEDYTPSRGANRATSIGAGQGLTRTQVSSNAADFLQRPTFEDRRTPDTTVTDSTVLTKFNSFTLGQIGNGTTALVMTAMVREAPKLGTDRAIGDDLFIDIFGPAWIDGSLQGVTVRALGWQLDDNADTISPIVASSTGDLDQ